MKKLLILLTLAVFLFSCSSDDSQPQEEMLEFPTGITLSNQSVSIGDILTINGNGFSPSQTYEVTFGGGVLGIINEINPSFLRVEVPENAMSGDITLTFNSVT